MPPPPRPKIPAEYAKVAAKLPGELEKSVGGAVTEFEQWLAKQAGDLSSNIESRSVQSADAVAGTKPAAVFDATVDGKTPNVKDKTEFEVYLDGLLGKTGAEPKAVEGSGAMKNTMINKPYESGSGVLMEKSGYTPKAAYPTANSVPLAPRDGYQKTINVREENARINEEIRANEAGYDKKLNPEIGLHSNSSDPNYPDDHTENIPGIGLLAPAAVGAGVLLSSQNAQAREPTLSEELQFDTVASEVKPSLTQKVKNTVRDNSIEQDKYTSTGAEARESTVLREIKDVASVLANRAKENLSFFAKDVGNVYNKYQAEKDQLEIRAQEFINHYESTNQTMLSDDDKELMKDFVGVVEGSPGTALLSGVSAVADGVSKFNQEVMQPLIKATQGVLRAHSEPTREIFRTYASSLAVLGETFAYPLLGNTGWNLVKGDETDIDQLDPVVQKLLQDKSSLLGSEAGAVMMSAVSGYKDLPMWLIGGSSKLGLVMGGIANELFVEDSKDSNLIRGGATGLIAGTLMQGLASSPIVKKGISLLDDKLKVPTNVKDMFSGDAVTYDSLPQHVSKVWQALVNKNTVEPMLMMTARVATKMADDAMLKVRPDVSEAMKTQVIAPQMLVLSVEPATGKPKLYGVKDGLYGELTDFVNPEGRPVMIAQIAKDDFPGNRELIDAWNKLIDPKRKTPPTRAHGIDEWTPDVIPPENPALVFAWKNMQEGKGGMMEVYRAGSREFNKDLLRSRELVRVEYTGADGRPETGLGFWGAGGDVVFAPDASEGIPGAIPRDLTFKQVRMNPNVPASGIPQQNQAWEINQLDDAQMYALVDDIKARNELTQEAAAEAAMGGKLADGTLPPDKRPPNPFDTDGMAALTPALAMAGDAMANNPNAATAAAAIAIAFLPPTKRAIGKALTKMNNAAGRAGLIGDTAYGELFKIDASIQAYSLRHYERLTSDLNKQLIAQFKNVKGNTPLAHKQFDDQLRYYIENHSINNPAPLPPQLNGVIQQKVQKYVAERNADYATIQLLGGTVPGNSPGGNAELEKLFALEYFTDEADKYTKSLRKKFDDFIGKDLTGNQWIDRMREQTHVPNSLINLIGSKKATRATKNMGQYDQVMGRMSTEMEMAKDYMNRKLDISRLGFMQELAKNQMASSPIANQALGHIKQVESQSAGLLKGKWVSEETYNAIYTYPEDQKMLQNTMLGIVNMVKFNKTVLNPTTWIKNIMGNVWGTMNSNIVPSWRMLDKMPHGMNVMRKDLAKFNADVMANDASVHRVHETLKYGLLGNEFESSRSTMQDVLSNLAEPIAATSNRTWGEKIASAGFTVKDKTLGGLAHLYSKVDMATKYSLYVNGLERWGIDLTTNKLGNNANARQMAADLLGASVAGNFAITDDVLTDMIKREVVRRIHLSLPMVDRIGPIPTALNKLSPITSPWLRTASELTRITLQMPYRMFNEKGYAVNALKTTSFLGTILGVNKALRLQEGISDEMVDDAKRIAPSNITNYMPGATATKFYAGEGKERGLVYVDMAGGLVEPAQMFKGGEVSDGTDATKRLAANTIDLVMGGGLLQEESKDIQAALGLTDSPHNYSIPFWKQGDTMRFVTQKALSAGPAFINTVANMYNSAEMPNSKGVRGKDKLEQPESMQQLKALGIPVATMGSKKQKEYKIAELENLKVQMLKKKATAGLQREGSPTGPLQAPYNKEEVQAKYAEEIKRLEEQIKQLRGSKSVKDEDDKPSLLNMDNMLTPHL